MTPTQARDRLNRAAYVCDILACDIVHASTFAITIEIEDFRRLFAGRAVDAIPSPTTAGHRTLQVEIEGVLVRAHEIVEHSAPAVESIVLPVAA